jgi:hypothetical protein
VDPVDPDSDPDTGFKHAIGPIGQITSHMSKSSVLSPCDLDLESSGNILVLLHKTVPIKLHLPGSVNYLCGGYVSMRANYKSL